MGCNTHGGGYLLQSSWIPRKNQLVFSQSKRKANQKGMVYTAMEICGLCGAGGTLPLPSRPWTSLAFMVCLSRADFSRLYRNREKISHLKLARMWIKPQFSHGKKTTVSRFDPMLWLCIAVHWCEGNSLFSRTEEKRAISLASWTPTSEWSEPACAQHFPAKALRGQCQAWTAPLALALCSSPTSSRLPTVTLISPTRVEFKLCKPGPAGLTCQEDRTYKGDGNCKGSGNKVGLGKKMEPLYVSLRRKTGTSL